VWKTRSQGWTVTPAPAAMRVSLAAVALALVLGACSSPAPTAGQLPFTTIEQKNDTAYIGQQQYFALDPGLMVFADAAAAVENEDLFSEAAREQLSRVDWRTQFVVAVFQGWQGGAGYGVTVTQVTLVGTSLRIYAEFQTPSGDPSGAVTSPYHLIAIRRPLTPVESLSIDLLVGDEVILVAATPTP
jgi:hypothetical protein